MSVRYENVLKIFIHQKLVAREKNKINKKLVFYHVEWSGTAQRRTHSPSRLAWSEGRQPLALGAALHSSDNNSNNVHGPFNRGMRSPSKTQCPPNESPLHPLIIIIIIIIIILGTSTSHTHLLPLMPALRIAKLALWLRWQRPGSHPNTQTVPIRTIFSRSLSRLWAPWTLLWFLQDLGHRISQVSGIHGKRPLSSSVLQSPCNASTPFCFDTLSLPMSPRTIQMPSHSSFWF